MGTQKAIAETIIDGEADYVLALKGNQETLHQAVIEHIDEQLDGDLSNAQEHVTIEKGHGRQETRTYYPGSEDDHKSITGSVLDTRMTEVIPYVLREL